MEVDYLSQNGVEELCVAIIRTAYQDLLRAKVLDASFEHQRDSYNAYLYCEEIRKSKRIYLSSSGNPTTLDQSSIKAIRATAKRDIEKLTDWFLHSKRFLDLSQNAEGKWFVAQANKKTEQFVGDRVMKYDIELHYSEPTNTAKKLKRQKKRELWRKNRDAWRKDHGLEEVKDE